MTNTKAPTPQNPVGWFEIYVQDMARAKTFYESVLGVTLKDMSRPEIEYWGCPQALDRYGSSGALVRMEGVPSGGNSTLIYFHCTDCAVEAERVKTAGGSVFRDKFSVGPYGFIVIAIDSEGNMFGLHSLK